jgi:hypothetical protein
VSDEKKEVFGCEVLGTSSRRMNATLDDKVNELSADDVLDVLYDLFGRILFAKDITHLTIPR